MKVRGEGFADLYRLEKLAQKDPGRALQEACREFEALFLQILLRGMERTVLRSGLFPEGLEMRVYRDLYYEQLARDLSGRGLGIARLLYRDLSQKMGLKPASHSAEKGGRR